MSIARYLVVVKVRYFQLDMHSILLGGVCFVVTPNGLNLVPMEISRVDLDMDGHFHP